MASQNSVHGPRPKTPTQMSYALDYSTSPKSSPSRSSRPSMPSPSRSPKNPVNTAWVQDQNRRVFLDHLSKWASNHDSGPYFHGKISLLSHSESSQSIALGRSVKCLLTDTAWTDARKQIVIRLFPPRLGETRYKLVVRCGAGWMSAREFLNKEYFILRHADQAKEKFPKCAGHLDTTLQSRSEMLGPKPPEKETISIQPLFHPFTRLPLELQQMILGTAAGLTDMYMPCRKNSWECSAKIMSAISLSTMFKISKSLNSYLVPWIYRTTNFNFELTGFTHFLWQSGPRKRPEIRHMTFRFGPYALIHCLRWLAPEPIFNLFRPKVPTSPRALRYFWRCQIQDYARELQLATLTIDISGVPDNEIPMMVRILRCCLGSVDCIRFSTGIVDVPRNSPRLAAFKQKKSWREMCREWFLANKDIRRWLPSDVRNRMDLATEKEMDLNMDFFDSREDG